MLNYYVISILLNVREMDHFHAGEDESWDNGDVVLSKNIELSWTEHESIGENEKDNFAEIDGWNLWDTLWGNNIGESDTHRTQAKGTNETSNII